MPSKNMLRKGKRRVSVKADYRNARDKGNDAAAQELQAAEAALYGQPVPAAAPSVPDTAVPDKPQRGYQKSGRRAQRTTEAPVIAPSEMDDDDDLVLPKPSELPDGVRKSWTADPGARGQRLDLHLAKMLPQISRALAQLLIEHGQVRVNGVVGKTKGKLNGGESIVVEGEPRPAPLRATPEDIPLNVVYEDRHLAVIDKPAGMMVHAGSGLSDDARSSGTLVNALLFYLKDQLSEVGGPLRPGIVHRLDKQTSGLILVAKSDASHRALADMFSDRSLEKRYIALVHRAVKSDRGLIDLLHAYPGVIVETSELVSILPRLSPRLYSISSSPAAHGRQVHCTIAVVRYRSHTRERGGIASTMLCDRVEVGARLPIYIQPNKKFRLPAADVPMIMIGPGTGIAPFRSFLHERQALGHKGRNWLFFGERSAQTDFLYCEELREMQQNGHLTRLDTAFSRDQVQKIYVQDRMKEHGAELWRWLADGAQVYVCGDASRMAKDVDAALHDVITDHGGMSIDAAKDFVSQLHDDRRYHRDVY